MCASVLNLKPLPYQTALTEPLMNVEPLTMQKKTQKTPKEMSGRWKIQLNWTEVTPKAFTFYFYSY